MPNPPLARATVKQLKRKRLSEAQEHAIDRLADFLTEDFEKRCTLLRAGDRMAIQWHQMRMAMRVVGVRMTKPMVVAHLKEFIYR